MRGIGDNIYNRQLSASGTFYVPHFCGILLGIFIIGMCGIYILLIISRLTPHTTLFLIFIYLCFRVGSKVQQINLDYNSQKNNISMYLKLQFLAYITLSEINVTISISEPSATCRLFIF